MPGLKSQDVIGLLCHDRDDLAVLVVAACRTGMVRQTLGPATWAIIRINALVPIRRLAPAALHARNSMLLNSH